MQYIGDLTSLTEEDWEEVKIPQRIKKIVREVVKRAFTHKMEKEDRVADMVREAELKSRKAKRDISIDMYSRMVALAVEDKVVTQKELDSLAKLRIDFELSESDHDKVLKNLEIDKKAYREMTKGAASSTNKNTTSASKATCLVCMEKEPDHIILDCMHLCLCRTCSSYYTVKGKTMQCPSCRADVREVRKVYWS